jgi:putative CocE/NonD family hydrolase
VTAVLVSAAAVAPVAPSTAVEPPARAVPGRPAPKLPTAEYESVSHEVLITMDDGVKLAATVALPSRDGVTPLRGRFPVVFGMTPYGRNAVCSCFEPEFWASHGFAGAAVDIRGAGGSGGNLERNYFSPREARDGARLVEWFGTRRWSSGRVGMAGGSYVGITQLLTAGQQPRHLKAIAPQVPLSDLYRDAFTHGGIPNLFFDAQYLGVQGAPGTAGVNTDPALWRDTLAAKLGQTPSATLALDYLARPEDDAFYRNRSPIQVARKIRVPVLLLGGWRDGLSQRGNPELFRVLSRRKGVETRMSMDPCTHKGCGAPFAPLNDPGNQHDPAALVFEFMAEHLRGDRVPTRAAVEYYVQGANRYRSASSWPPPSVRFERFDLGQELRPVGTATQTPGTASYVTNPAAGMSLAFNQFGTVAATPYLPLDQRLEGPQGASFQTAPLTRPMELAGPLALHLVAATTAKDTDWHVRLVDVAPEGSEQVISEGALRASHRALDPDRSTPARPYHPHTRTQPVTPNQFAKYAVEIWPTAYRLAAGHRLLVRVTSTDLPTHLPGWIDLDADDPSATAVHVHEPARNTIRFAGSHLVLPVS